MTATRIPPTPEDAAIVARSVKRIFRWDLEVARKRGEKTDGLALLRTLRTLRAATGDYLEFGAGLAADGSAIAPAGKGEPK